MKNCLDCLNCKIIPAKLILRCSAAYWKKDHDGAERILKLKPIEAHLIRIEHRNIFLQAKSCNEYNNMNPQ